MAKAKIIPFFWYAKEAEEAAKFYTSIFHNSKIGKVVRYSEGSPGPAGSVMTVLFELDGQEYMGLNGGPIFKFTEAISLMVECADQKEVDHFWSKLLEGGAPQACGWLKDKYGLSWQIVPKVLGRMLQDKDQARTNRVMHAVMQMVKLDVAKLEAAYG